MRRLTRQLGVTLIAFESMLVQQIIPMVRFLCALLRLIFFHGAIRSLSSNRLCVIFVHFVGEEGDDSITSLSFDHAGDFLATGDQRGYVSIFVREHSKKPQGKTAVPASRSRGAPFKNPVRAAASWKVCGVASALILFSGSHTQILFKWPAKQKQAQCSCWFPLLH